MSRRLVSHASALLALLLLATVLWVHRIHVDPPSGHGVVAWDLQHYYLAHATHLGRELAAGRLPLWNPHQLAGYPLLAIHMPALLDPVQLLLLALLPPRAALEVRIVLHLAVAGGATWLFLRALGLRAAAAFAGALCFMLSGRLLYLVYFPSFLATVAWLPALLFALHRLLVEPRVRWAVALACATSLCLLGGYAQGFVHAAQLAAAYALFGWVALARGRRKRVLALGAAAAVAAFGLSAPQVLPTLELLGRGGRDLGGLSFEEAAAYPVPAQRLGLGLVGLRPRSDDPGTPQTWTLPVLALPLMACSVLARGRRRHAAFFAASGVTAALLSLGDQTPLFRLYHALPLGDAFRVPQRFGSLYFFSSSVLCAIGMHGLLGRLERRRPGRLPAAAVGALLVAVLAVDLYAGVQLPDRHLAPPPAARPDVESAVAALRERAGLERIYHEGRAWPRRSLLEPKTGTTRGLFATPDYESLLPRAYHEYFRARSPLWKGELDLAGPFATLPLPLAARLLDLLSVRYYVLEPHLADADRRRLVAGLAGAGGRAERLGPLWIVRRHQALPRAYAVFRTLPVATRQDALARLASPGFDPQREAVVEREGPRLAGAAGRWRARIERHGPHEVALRARCSRPCLLVLTDLFFPGWEVRVDGRPAAVHRVNHLLRGVVLEAGRHEVVHRYRPRPFRWGVAIGLGTALALAAWALAARRRAPARGTSHR